MAISPETQEWVAKAEADAIAARMLRTKAPTELGWIVAFHCQQSAEKYLKAFLTEHRVSFPRTHDLRALVAHCTGVDRAFAELEDAALQLQPFAVEVRYPGCNPQPDVVTEALANMEAVRTVTRSVLGLKTADGADDRGFAPH